MMTEKTKPSQYLLDQEHITDREIDQIYNLTKELTLQLDQFRDADKKYRSLEEVNSQESEKERVDILNNCMLMIDKIDIVLSEIESTSQRTRTLFVKAKGALEEKLEMGK